MTRICGMHIYLRGTAAISFALAKGARSCKNYATLCHASVEQPLVEIKVFGQAKMEDETQSVMPRANAHKHMPIKMSSGMS